jgi:hypothetical protein
VFVHDGEAGVQQQVHRGHRELVCAEAVAPSGEGVHFLSTQFYGQP